jgi:hypothetical protein
MILLEALPLLQALAPAFTQPTFRRVVLLLGAALLTTGRRTVANVLRTLAPLTHGHRTSYQRVLSHAEWSGLRLACLFSRFLIQQLLPTGLIRIAGDDTVDGHKGKRVYGKARHRDPVRSTHSYTTWRYGHRWVVLAVLVRFPGAPRPWALPVLVVLYRVKEDNRRRRRPHRTPAQLLCRLLWLLLRWFPDRRFLLVVDSGFGSHEVARFVRRYHPRLVLISKLHPQANLYTPPPRYRGKGRPRVKGQPLPKPCQVVDQAQRRRHHTVDWYGGGQRQVTTVTGTGQWYKTGRGLVPVRWVHVRDVTGTHRDEYFYTTDPDLTPAELIGHYTARWNLETTFQELRAHLGLETTRGWCRTTVLRAAPCLFGLYSVVAWLYQHLPSTERGIAVDWPGKEGFTFSDALTAVRRWLWSEGVFPQAGEPQLLQKLPEPLRILLLSTLAPAA